MSIALTRQDFADLAELAGYAIGYWADSAYLEPAFYTVIESDTGDSHKIPMVRMEQVMTKLVAGHYEVSDGLKSRVRSGDMGELDGADVDVLFQLCAFDEVVYG